MKTNFWKPLGIVAVVLWLLTSAALASILLHGNSSRGDDERSVVNVTPAERDLSLREMRGLLLATHEILAAMSQSDRERAAAAADKVGMKLMWGVAEKETTILAKLPAPMKALGISTHQQMDGLALKLRSGALDDGKALSGELARITQNCVSCHAAYRLAQHE
jgi:hypothetical protein